MNVETRVSRRAFGRFVFITAAGLAGGGLAGCVRWPFDSRPAEVKPGPCEDGELVFSLAASAGEVLPRTPLGESVRADILELSWEGPGFGGRNRAIAVVPRLGSVWSLNAEEGATTIAERGFCGTNDEVTAWAVKAHIPSLQQASRDKNGNEPPAEEISVVRFDYEARAMRVVRRSSIQRPEDILARFDLSFHEGSNRSNVPLHVQ